MQGNHHCPPKGGSEKRGAAKVDPSTKSPKGHDLGSFKSLKHKHLSGSPFRFPLWGMVKQPRSVDNTACSKFGSCCASRKMTAVNESWLSFGRWLDRDAYIHRARLRRSAPRRAALRRIAWRCIRGETPHFPANHANRENHIFLRTAQTTNRTNRTNRFSCEPHEPSKCKPNPNIPNRGHPVYLDVGSETLDLRSCELKL